MTAADHEVELKFVCGPDDLAAVLAAAPPGEDSEAELISVYFDTPDLALAKAGASLRVRESKGRRVQTVKRGEGLTREEFEAPIDSLAPDPALGPLPKLVPDGASLKPAFNVRVSRRQRTFLYEGAKIELALDQGEVVGGDGRASICEVELELKSGPQGALFDFARKLLGAAPLYLSFDSKAARGQALVAGRRNTARRSEKAPLEGEETVAEAFQATARKALAQIAANAQVLREAPSPEATHQLRVGARRLRSTMTTFGEVIEDDATEAVKAELRWLSRAGDRARNLDVYAQALVGAEAAAPHMAAGVATLRKLVGSARRRARDEVVETASSPRFRLLLLDVAAWIETGAWRRRKAARGPVKPFAREALKRRRRKMLKKGKGVAHAPDESLHELRIAAKKLRYAGDALASLYPKKRVAAFTGCVKDLQTELGQLNDLATQGPLIETLSLPAEAAFAAGQLLGERRARRAEGVAAASKALDRLAKAEPFWGD